MKHNMNASHFTGGIGRLQNEFFRAVNPVATRLCGPLVAACMLAQVALAGAPNHGLEVFHSVPENHWQFGGVVAPRLEANTAQWLLPAPDANPAMLEMFRLRDRQPVPKLVPWAGEFAGKYLISCVQALRLTDRPDLRAHTSRFVMDLISTQAADGYLGPFPQKERLLGHWDLWGHYHVMQGLLAWHDLTGDEPPLAATRRAADLICRTFLDGKRRVFDAGSQEMNMAVAHVMAELHRRTGETRYLAMTHEIVKDWERAGDYLRTGSAGTPFFQTPKPRWESLHDLQALAELWRITGETRYRDAFTSHWRTIREFDRRNSGAFSGGEKATGNAFAPSAIETCCTVAWMALSCDMLRLTGDPRVADELELSTFNAALGAQHPTGRWWTYNTPMDGERKSSAHDIVFQARAGSPELNCCSVNGPRTLGMLSDWAVMGDDHGLVVNWLGPLTMVTKDSLVTLRSETSYPLDGHIVWHVTSKNMLRLRIRIPAWAEGAHARVAGNEIAVKPGTYLEIERLWHDSDQLELDLPLALRPLEGRRDQAGRASIYRGPLLLAYDQRDNTFDEPQIPRLDLSRLSDAKVVAGSAQGAPWLLVELPAIKGALRLRDFASAGASGTRYRSWLSVTGADVPLGPDGLIVSADLHGDPKPQFGQLVGASPSTKTEDGNALRLNGKDERLTYALPEIFGPDFSVIMRVRIRELPGKRAGQLFSAWAGPMDDPVRITLDRGRLFARTEAGRSYSTAGVQIPLNEWHHIAAVKSGTTLTLYIDGKNVAATEVPAVITTSSRLFALGGNPVFAGPEFLPADFAELVVRNRALSKEEVARLSRP